MVIEVTEWIDLVDSPEDARHSAMRQRYLELLEMSAEERSKALNEMIRAEYEMLPTDKLRRFNKSRLLVWLDLEEEKRRAIVSAFEKVMDEEAAPWTRLGVTGGETVRMAGVIDSTLSDLDDAWRNALERAIA